MLTQEQIYPNSLVRYCDPQGMRSYQGKIAVIASFPFDRNKERFYCRWIEEPEDCRWVGGDFEFEVVVP